MIVVIAEKPSVAKDLARHLNANNRRDGYFEGNGHQVTWAFGHLVRLAGPKDYDIDNRIESLPILPDDFILKGPDDNGAKKQLRIIANLFNSCNEIVVATDAGREGELIFRYIYDYLNCQKPFKRLWISSLTTDAIAKGWKNLKPGSEFNALYYSAKARSESDWIIGMNASISFTRSAQSEDILSLGRVQTPVLSIICNRYEEHQSFKSLALFTPVLELQVEGQILEAKWSGDTLYDRESATKILNDLPDDLQCISYEAKPKIEKPPLLFDLTSLQREANKRFGLTAKQTLQAAQKLYESKYLTYPRTDSRYLTTDLFESIPALLTTLSQLDFIKPFDQAYDLDNLPNRTVNDAKVSDHHAIIPTGLILATTQNTFTDYELRVYRLVVLQTFAAFSAPCEKHKVHATFSHSFQFNQTSMVSPGWRSYLGSEESEEDVTALNVRLEAGHTLQISSRNIKEGKTKPKPLFTDDSLLNAMETCGRELDDEALKQALKGKGIGTPATRADTIELLIKRDYIRRDKKYLIPSERGIAIHKAVSDLSLASPSMTGDWESKLTQIADGSYTYESFLDQIANFVNELIPSLIDRASTLRHLSSFDISCPKCKNQQLHRSRYYYQCSDECGFKLSRSVASHQLTEDQLNDLLDKKETPLIKTFRKKDGSGTFSAILTLTDDYELVFKFPDFNKDTDCICPACESQSIRFNDHKAFCTSCEFQLFRTIAHKKLTDAQLTQLFTKGITSKVSGFKKKTGGTFSAQIILEQGKTKFHFS